MDLTKLPEAKKPDSGFKGKLRPCFHCRRDLIVSRWDNWNGFLVKCPYCGRPHGRNWKFKSILWASFFISALSFFFTMRPWKAALLILIYISIGFVGNSIIDKGYFPQWLEFVAVVIFAFTPMITNAGLIVVHESQLGKSPDNKKSQVSSLLQEILNFFS